MMGRAARTPLPGRAPARIAVLDTVEAWEREGRPARPVVVLRPGSHLALQLDAVEPTRVVVNLACSGTLAATWTLRGARTRARFLGCVTDERRERALALGPVAAAAAAVDPEVLAAAVVARAVPAARVVVVGADVDAMVGLRYLLTRRGMSVSMAWEGKQGQELLASGRPAIVVVDLDRPAPDAYDVVARLPTLEPVPLAMLVGGHDDEVAGRFAALLADPRHSERTVSLDELLSRAADD